MNAVSTTCGNCGQTIMVPPSVFDSRVRAYCRDAGLTCPALDVSGWSDPDSDPLADLREFIEAAQ